VDSLVNDLIRLRLPEPIELLSTLCRCPQCPSYRGTGERGEDFCQTDPSQKIQEEKGCLCGTCYSENNTGVKQLYFCKRQ